MTKYYRVFLGAASKYAEQCFKDGFIGADFNVYLDLSAYLTDNSDDLKPIFDEAFKLENPNKSKIVIGLARSATWKIAKGISESDLILCPDGKGNYRIAKVIGDYYYVVNQEDRILPHRRPVIWLDPILKRSDMSQALQNSTGSIGTVGDISAFGEEIECLMNQNLTPPSIQPDVEDPIAFQLEKYLEDFLVSNWEKTLLGQQYNIYEIEGERVGQQFEVDTGKIDILAISKDKKTLLVIELKRGRASDNVIGQIQRYMGYVQEELAESDQMVKGVVIAFEDDLRIRRALAVAPNIDFYRYELSFKLTKN